MRITSQRTGQWRQRKGPASTLAEPLPTPADDDAADTAGAGDRPGSGDGPAADNDTAAADKPAAGGAVTAVRRWMPRLGTVVFPPPAAPQRSGGRSMVGYLVGFAAAAVYLLVIPAGRSRLDRVWGEDGVIFLNDALHNGVIAPIFTAYTGYLHLLPRLSAVAISHLPVAWWAAAFGVTAALLRAAMAVLVYAATSGHLRSRTFRLVIAASVVVLPSGNSEALGNLANLHWFALFTAFWLLLWRPERAWQSALAALTLPLLVLTTPLGLLLLPIAVARLALPTRRDRLPATAYLLGLAAALVPIMSAPARPHDPVDPTALTIAAAARGPMVTLTGPEVAGHFYPKVARIFEGWYSWPVAAATVVTLGLAGIAVVGANASSRFLAIACLLLGTAVVVLSLAANWADGLRIDRYGVVYFVQRYSAGPCLFFLTAIAVGLAHRPRPPWRRYAVVAARVAVAVMIGTGVVYQWHSPAPRLKGITWSEARARAERICDGSRATEVAITTIPEQRTYIRVSCSRLR